jgi:hypothetical protein
MEEEEKPNLKGWAANEIRENHLLRNESFIVLDN